jgi:hypothetical protein
MPIRIDAGALLAAMSDHSTEFFLDRETGEVIPNAIELFPSSAPEHQRYLEMADDPRYLVVETVPSGTAWDWMAAFVENVMDARARRVLSHALEGKRAFRRFKDALGEFPTLREAWFDFETARLRAAAVQWLEDEGLDAVLDEGGETTGSQERGIIG